MEKEIDRIISEIKATWSKDEIIRFLYVKLAPFFKRDLNYFMAEDDEKYRQYQQGFINRGFDIVCSTISDYYVKLFSEFGIEAKKVAANSAKIPLFAVIVKGNHSWFYIDPLNDLFHNQYGLNTTEFGVLPHYKTLNNNYPFLDVLPSEYVRDIDKKIQLPETLDSFFQELHMEMTERNYVFDFFGLEKEDYTALFDKKIEFINKYLLNKGQVNGPFERISLYLFLERMLFFKKEKKNILIKLVKEDLQYIPYIEYANHNKNQVSSYIEEEKDGNYTLVRKK